MQPRHAPLDLLRDAPTIPAATRISRAQAASPSQAWRGSRACWLASKFMPHKDHHGGHSRHALPASPSSDHGSDSSGQASDSSNSRFSQASTAVASDNGSSSRSGHSSSDEDQRPLKPKKETSRSLLRTRSKHSAAKDARSSGSETSDGDADRPRPLRKTAAPRSHSKKRHSRVSRHRSSDSDELSDAEAGRRGRSKHKNSHSRHRSTHSLGHHRHRSRSRHEESGEKRHHKVSNRAKADHCHQPRERLREAPFSISTSIERLLKCIITTITTTSMYTSILIGDGRLIESMSVTAMDITRRCVCKLWARSASKACLSFAKA